VGLSEGGGGGGGAGGGRAKVVEADACDGRAQCVFSLPEEGLYVFNDTIEGPRAPAVKPGRITQA